MMDEMGLRPVGIDVARQGAVDTLMEHFVNDVLEMSEFERRLDIANHAVTEAELNKPVSDLPATNLPAPAPSRGGAPVVVAADRVSERAYLVSLMGGDSRYGRWIPARSNFAVGVMGGLSLDFREAMLAPGVTEVNVFTLMGGAEIIVSPEMDVEVSGFAFMGGFEHDTDQPIHTNPERPTLRIKYFSIMGGVGVAVRFPGETPREAKKRRKLERKSLVPRLAPPPETIEPQHS
jgi:hypothetical protein